MSCGMCSRTCDTLDPPEEAC
uniref:Uncharacterized protein n=1 Tax=Zea mays TaxID=4577 RepID=C0PBC8_MAIZE|nr:unknown [Zea mays]